VGHLSAIVPTRARTRMGQMSERAPRAPGHRNQQIDGGVIPVAPCGGLRLLCVGRHGRRESTRCFCLHTRNRLFGFRSSRSLASERELPEALLASSCEVNVVWRSVTLAAETLDRFAKMCAAGERQHRVLPNFESAAIPQEVGELSQALNEPRLPVRDEFRHHGGVQSSITQLQTAVHLAVDSALLARQRVLVQ
jgi:hypothetical protein